MAARTGTFKHGHSGYTNYCCRCDVCKEARRAYMTPYCREWRARNRAARLAEQALDG